MVAHVDGRFIWGRCGHVEIPNVQYECNCGNCANLKRVRIVAAGSLTFIALQRPTAHQHKAEQRGLAGG